MNRQHAILIRADTRTVSDVHALCWNGVEIRKKLLVGNEEIVYFDFRYDSLVVRAVPNIASDDVHPVKDGFELLGHRYYGNALILGDEGRLSPKTTPEEIAQAIRFFREDGGTK